MAKSEAWAQPRGHRRLGAGALAALFLTTCTAWAVAIGRPEPTTPKTDLRAAAHDLVLSWMFGSRYEDGGPKRSDPTVAAARNFRGLFWHLVGAYPPGLTGGYFGHWSYPSEA
jgi:hypothetical protein